MRFTALRSTSCEASDVGELVWAACVSHAGGQLRVRTGEGEEQLQMDRVYAAWDRLRASLDAARPDVLIGVGTDHFQTFSYDFMPVFAVGRGETTRTWGEFGTGALEVAGAPELADVIHRELVHAGFDVVGSTDMRLDHAYSCPLAFLSPDGAVPVVPVFVNSFVPPLPSLRRCRKLGEAIGAAVRGPDDASRVAIVGTGGISHWVGVPGAGQINPTFDERFLELFEASDLEALERLDDATLVGEAGPGAGELRCWMVVLGAAGALGARRLAYEPVEAWITGISLVEVAV
jgi:aromatic ring-opening dioxygenase catalytic subunit (LigB family)